MSYKGIAITFFVVVSASAVYAQEGTQEVENPREAFNQAMAEFQALSVKRLGDEKADALREKIIRLSLSLKPPVPEEARRPFIRAVTLHKEVKTIEDYAPVVAEYQKALDLCPWWADAYYNIGTVLSLVERYDEAIRAYSFYIMTKPEDARVAQDKIYALEVKAEKRAAIVAVEEEKRAAIVAVEEERQAAIAAAEELAGKYASPVWKQQCKATSFFLMPSSYYLAFSPDGKKLAGGTKKTVELWDAGTGELLRTLKCRSLVNSIAFSPDGKRLALAWWDRTAKLWDANTGEHLQTLRVGGLVNSVAFSPDGKTLASGSSKRTVKLWDVETGELLRTLECGSWVRSVSFSPDGKKLAGWCGKSVEFWDAETGASLRTLPMLLCKWHTSYVAFSWDGETLASGCNQSARLWDANTGELLRTVHVGVMVDSFAFSPDGKMFAVGGRGGNKTAELWSARTGKLLRTVSVGKGLVNSIAFSPDGKMFAARSGGGTISLWE